MHMILDGYEWKAAIARHAEKTDDTWIRQQIEGYYKQGYTYLRDGGDRWGAGKRAREIAGEYGITYRTPLANLCKAGHYGSFIGKKYENFREYRDLIVQQREEGADFVKIMISGLMDFDRFGRLTEEGLPAEEIWELIHIAHEEGFAVMAHCNGARTAEAAAAAGLDSLEHGAYLDKDALQAMADTGTVWVPTLSAVGNLRGKGRFNEDAVQKILDSALENLREFSAMGGLIAPGSDAGAWAVPHGCMTEENLLKLALEENTEAILEAGTRKIKEKF
jgi:imidazolonepropionase-like amidohydrolase